MSLKVITSLERKKLYAGIAIVLCGLFAFAAVYTGSKTTTGSSIPKAPTMPKNPANNAELYCKVLEKNSDEYQLCVTALQHILSYIKENMQNTRIVGRRFRYLSREGIWLFGLYVLDESNHRQVVTYDPRSGEVVVSPP